MSVANEKFTEHESIEGITITFERDCKLPYDVFVDKVVSAVLLNNFVTIDEGNTELVSFMRKVTLDVRATVKGKVPNLDARPKKAIKKTTKKPRNG